MRNKDPPTNDRQRKILELNRDHPEWTPTDIAHYMAESWVKPSYCKRIIEDMALPEETKTISMATVTSKSTDSEDETGAEEEAETEKEEPEAGDGVENNEPVQYSSRPFSSLGSKAKEVLTIIRDDPELTLGEVYDEASASDRYVRTVIRRHSEFVPDDAAVWEKLRNPRKVHDADNIQSDAERRIVKTIQENPDLTRDEGAEKADVSKNTFGDAMAMFEHLLPEEWCERFPSLSDGGKLPYNEGDVSEEVKQKISESRSGIAAGGGSSSATISAEPADGDGETEPPMDTDADRDLNEAMDNLFDDDGYLQTAKVQQKEQEQEEDEADGEDGEELHSEKEVADELDLEPDFLDDEGDDDGGDVYVGEGGEEYEIPEPDELEEELSVELDLTDIGMEPTDQFRVDETEVQRLREEAESIPELSDEMVGYKAGIERALKALGLDD